MVEIEAQLTVAIRLSFFINDPTFSFLAQLNVIMLVRAVLFTGEAELTPRLAVYSKSSYNVSVARACLLSYLVLLAHPYERRTVARSGTIKFAG